MVNPKRTVRVYLQRPGLDAEKRLISSLPRDKLLEHSAEFAAFLESWPVDDESQREIVLPEGSPSALQHVFGIIKAHRGRQGLYINLKDLTIPQKLAVWNACQLLDIRPKDALKAVGNNLAWVISHAKTTPEIMRATYDCTIMFKDSKDKDQSKLWHSMIHQYVWDLIHGKFEEQEEEALIDTYSPYSELAAAIDAKYDELKAKYKVFHANREENHRRRANRRIRRTYERRDAARERVIEEVAAGVRPMSERLREAVLARERVPS
ncbi:hypothetical protein M409DRAFT_22161 [Zasmidium cellare ATCC 36951]|uniref:BTB domain-containing protein n=1 Tax=Zasmidium cellare ATCC 36951 TaxID=1080233 RepID=A0A6A6CJZ0_ZASCE|nr:uncharacterized protein M409DRAFT_22161 [Zasmidium cellare ATCC 36951]KAF2167351.1 hypothetical protein M409DRAFT_22161 [Zasmidium cellare ATCC 36951]